MIYISSSCIRSQKISKSIRFLAEEGYRNIELSGGTEYYDGLLEEVLDLKSQYGLNLLCHNYFPPPLQHFTLNLASLNEEIFQRSVDFITHAIRFSSAIGADKYGFHAGYFIDPDHRELGKPISRSSIANHTEAENSFWAAHAKLREINPGVKLYIENNVISKDNFKTYSGNPLMLTGYEEYREYRQKREFNLLLDVAHLKVSCTTMGRDFEEEFSKLINETDYIHLSDNNGCADQNLGIDSGGDILHLLKKYKPKDKTITLEVYENPEKIKETYLLLQSILS